jgi:regulatory protein
MLARRALSRRELGERLSDKGFATAAIAAEVERLHAAGLLNDLELARAVCRTRLRQGKGKRAIETEFWRRHVEPQAGAQAVAELVGDEVAGALEAAMARVVKRCPLWRRLPRERAKVVRYLLTRGFDAAEVRRVLGREPDEENDAVTTFDTPDP